MHHLNSRRSESNVRCASSSSPLEADFRRSERSPEEARGRDHESELGKPPPWSAAGSAVAVAKACAWAACSCGWRAWTAAATGSAVAGLVLVWASLPAISGICGFEGLVARISGYSSDRYLLNGSADHLGEGAHMKRVLVIATGGTIASAEEGSGLAPALTGEQLVAFVPEVAQMCHAEVSQVMNVDSTNMRPEGWLAIAGEVRRRYDDFDGFVVLHGTDTLAYTAAGLSYLVQGACKPIVLTGSQLPMGQPGTDGVRNVTDAGARGLRRCGCGRVGGVRRQGDRGHGGAQGAHA